MQYICPCTAQRRPNRNSHLVLYYSLRTVEPAGSSLVLNNTTGFWQAQLVRNMFSLRRDPVNEKGKIDEYTQKS